MQPDAALIADRPPVLPGRAIRMLGGRLRRRRPACVDADAILRASRDAIAALALDGTVTSWNPAAERIYGYAADEMVGRSIGLLAAGPEQEREILETLARARRGEHADAHELIQRRKDGTLPEMSVTVTPIRDARHRIIGAAAVAREREPAPRGDEDRFRRAFEHAPIGMAIIDEHGRILHANAALARVGGQSVADLERGSLWQLVSEPDLEDARATLRALLTGEGDQAAVQLQFEGRS